MQNLNILYVHGYQSSGHSKTAESIRIHLPKVGEGKFSNITVLSPMIPQNPEEAIPFIKNFVSENSINCVVGSSLGGFHVINTPLDKSVPKILINPLVDSMEIFNVDLKNPLIQLTQKIYKKHLVEFMLPTKQNIFAIFSKNDDILNHVTQSKRLRFYYGCDVNNMIFIDDEHNLTQENLKSIVCPIIINACSPIA